MIVTEGVVNFVIVVVLQLRVVVVVVVVFGIVGVVAVQLRCTAVRCGVAWR